MSNFLTLNIGGIGVRLEQNRDASFALVQESQIRPFLTKEDCPEVFLKAHQDQLSFQNTGELIFSSPDGWSLRRDGDLFYLYLFSLDFGSRPYRWAVFNSDFSVGDIFIHPKAIEAGLVDAAFNYPLDELFFINYLWRKEASLIHASGLICNKSALVFAGVSGAGKSTMVKLWREAGFDQVLNDDRLIIRRIDNAFYCYGTPWHGEIKQFAALKNPLSTIFLLKQSDENYVRDLSSSEVISRLLGVSFAPFWDKEGMSRILTLYEELVQSVTVCELGFTLDQRVVDFIRGYLDGD